MELKLTPTPWTIINSQQKILNQNQLEF